MSSGFSYVKPASGELGTFTKAQLDTAVTDGNVVFVGDALNGTLGATTPASVAATTGAFSDQLSLSHTPAVSESVMVLTGSVLTGGTGTTNFPAILCQPTGTTAATAWSTGGTWFGVNAASGFAGRFLDFRVNGAAGVFSVNSAGWLNMSGVFASSRTSISGTAAVSYTGSVFTGGTGTTNLPHILAEPSGTTAATTWSTSGTFVGINAASGFAGNFIDLRLNGGASLFAIASTGAITGLSITESANAATGTGGLVRATSPTLVTPNLGTPSALVVTNATGTASININGTVGATTPASVAATTITATSISLSGADASANLIATSASGGITISRAGAPGMWLFPGDGRYVMVSTGYTGWTSGSSPTSGQDSRISRSSAGVLQIGTTANNALGSLLLTNLTASGTLILGTYTVGTLPSAASNTRARAFVTDSNLAFNSTNLGSTVTAGGSTLAPVFSNGTNWVIG